MSEPDRATAPDRLRAGALVAVAVGLVLLLAAGVVAVTRAGDDGDPPAGHGGPGAPPTTGRPGTSSVETAPEGGALPLVTGTFAPGREPLPGFGEVAVRVVAVDGEGRLLCVLVADTEDQRRRGLMEVTDPTLGGYDGMLFRYPGDHTGAFWMRNTPMPLSIAYLDGRGAIVSTADMVPCRDSPSCPGYPAAGPFRSALEAPLGRLDDLGIVAGARVEVAGPCRSAPS